MDRPQHRTAIAKYVFLAVLVIAGGSCGLYLSTHSSVDDQVSSPNEPTPAAQRRESDRTPTIHRFPLTTLDAKDTVEAPDIAINLSGRLFLTWASKTGDKERTVFLARTADSGDSYEAPRIISCGGIYKTVAKDSSKGGGYERRATPHVGVEGDRVCLSWSEALSNGAGMKMLIATSTDAGTTFGPARQINNGERSKPTFTAMTVDSRGAIACSWLDDRMGSQRPFAAIRQPGVTEFESERLVYQGQGENGVCPCCPTAVTFGADGTLYVAFRNIQDGYRDIAVNLLKPGAGKFEGPFPIVPNTWKFDGCPHDGPSLVVIGETLHVLWMDARSGLQRCFYGWAKLTDMKFDVRELHPGTAGSQGNAKLFADSSGNLHAVWEESIGTEPTLNESPNGHQHGQSKVGSGAGRAIVYAQMPKGSNEFKGYRTIAPKQDAFQTRPCIAVKPTSEVYVAWNELDTSGKAVVVAHWNESAHTSASDGVRP